MSFSSDLKEELSAINNFKNKDIIIAEFLGYILSSNTNFSSLGNDELIEYITENEFNIERFYKILFALELEYEPEIRGKVFVAKIKKDEKLNEYLKIKVDLKEDEEKAILRGAFLGSGSINNPEKQYHLEISFSDKKAFDYINNICTSF